MFMDDCREQAISLKPLRQHDECNRDVAVEKLHFSKNNEKLGDGNV
jgi:hypothetical protein